MEPSPFPGSSMSHLRLELHSHTVLSDGELLATELARRAIFSGHRVIGITDHVSPGNLGRVISGLRKDCEVVNQNWEIVAVPGVEVTHVPKGSIPSIVKEARYLGAELVIVHGETPAEPVEPGTNRAALGTDGVDILAHPGAITFEEAELAADMGIALEVSARAGHRLTNRRVVEAAYAAGADLVVGGDVHSADELLTGPRAAQLARRAGVREADLIAVLYDTPLEIVRRAGYSVKL